jgi:hypothetical protein
MADGRRLSRLLLPTPEVGAECWGGRVWNGGVEGLGSWNKRQSQEECVRGEGFPRMEAGAELAGGELGQWPPPC